jgi:hypothetical protein
MLERSIDFSIVTARFTLNVISVIHQERVPVYRTHQFCPSNVGKIFVIALAALLLLEQ